MKFKNIFVTFTSLLLLTIFTGCPDKPEDQNKTQQEDENSNNNNSNENSNNNNSNENNNNNNGTSSSIPESLRGEWLYVDTGEKIQITFQSELDYEIYDDNLISIIDSSGKTRHLLRSGINKAEIKGLVRLMSSSSVKMKGFSGIGNIDVVLVNVKDNDLTVTTTTQDDGSFNSEDVVSGQYDITLFDGEGNNIEFPEVTIDEEKNDIGVLTITAEGTSYNFKTEFISNIDYMYDSLSYSGTVRIHNVGTTTGLGLNYTISSSDEAVKSLDYDITLGTLLAGKFIEIPITINFNSITNENGWKKVKMDVVIKDAHKNTWEDYVYLNVYRTTIKININTALAGVRGYLIVPGHNLIHIDTGSSTIEVPYQSDEKYLLVLSNPDLEAETAYSIGIGAETLSFENFQDTSLFEINDSETTATAISLNDAVISYLHLGDIDFYTIDMAVSPAAPENLTISVENGEGLLNWNPVSGATMYNLYWSTTFEVSKENYDGIIENITETSYIHIDISDSADYYYIVAGVNGGGIGAESNMVNLLPDLPLPPENVTTIFGNNEITLSWGAGVRAVTYNLYWSSNTNVSKTSYGGVITDITETSYTHTEIENDSVYYYVVTSVNGGGESNISTEVNSMAGTPPASNSVSASAGDEEVDITWDSVPRAVTYNIYWSTATGISKENYEGIIENITDTSYTHQTLSNGIVYYYIVCGVNEAGIGSSSIEVKAIAGTPANPVNIAAIPGDNTITIAWDAAFMADTYNLYWSGDADISVDNYTAKITGITETSYTHTDIDNGTVYYYLTTGVNNFGESNGSSVVNATPGAPPKPENISALLSTNDIIINWDASPIADSYNIYWSTGTRVSQQNNEGMFTGITTLSYTHTGITDNLSYYYVVTGVNIVGEGNESTEVSIIPEIPVVPLNIRTDEGDSEITVSWDESSRATAYNLYWSTNTGVTKDNNEGRVTNINTTSTTIPNLTNGITYYFIVTGINSGGESNGSSEMSGISGTPSAPANTTAISVPGKVTITWDSVIRADSYILYWSTSTGVSKLNYEGRVLDITETSYTHTELTPTTYYYVVTGVNSVGEGSISNETSAEVSIPEGMVYIQGGCFQMGDTFGGGDSDETPVHEVCVDDFLLGEHEVTQGEWKAVMGSNPSYFNTCGDDCPVEQVSWDDAQDFITKYNQQTGGNYRLPTEAEWEYAAREKGKDIKWAGTSIESELGNYAWYSGNSGSKSHQVKTKSPNSLGLYDMSGNVWEWVQDWYGSDYYSKSPKDNPTGPNSGSERVIRGGGWYNAAGYARAAYRYLDRPGFRSFTVGLRLFRTL